MKTILKAVLAALFLFSINSATSAQTNAGHLAAACEHSASTLGDLKTAGTSDVLCTALIAGWRNVFDRLPVLTPNRDARIEIEKTASIGQLIRVYVAYVKAHPDVENIDQFFVFIYASRDAGLMKEVKETK